MGNLLEIPIKARKDITTAGVGEDDADPNSVLIDHLAEHEFESMKEMYDQASPLEKRFILAVLDQDEEAMGRCEQAMDLERVMKEK